MSVRGEFARSVAEAAACLSESRESDARRLVERLQRARELAQQDLEAAARALISEWESRPPDALALPAATEARLDEASERMLAIARIILGR
jgi:hypothetical protein